MGTQPCFACQFAGPLQPPRAQYSPVDYEAEANTWMARACAEVPAFAALVEDAMTDEQAQSVASVVAGDACVDAGTVQRYGESGNSEAVCSHVFQPMLRLRSTLMPRGRLVVPKASSCSAARTRKCKLSTTHSLLLRVPLSQRTTIETVSASLTRCQRVANTDSAQRVHCETLSCEPWLFSQCCALALPSRSHITEKRNVLARYRTIAKCTNNCNKLVPTLPSNIVRGTIFKEVVQVFDFDIHIEKAVLSQKSCTKTEFYAFPANTEIISTDSTVASGLTPVTVYVDSCAPRGVTSRKDAIVKVTNSSPSMNLRGVGGVVPVEAVVTIGYYVPVIGSERLHYFEVEDCLYCPAAQAELYPTRASFVQANRTHHFEPLCHIQCADGTQVPFDSTERGYKINAFYGPPPMKQEEHAFPAIDSIGGSANLTDDVPISAPKTPFILYLGSGIRRMHDLANYIETTSTLVVMHVDIKLGGRHHDMTKVDVAERIILAASLKHCVGLMVSTPCATWSAARYNEKEGLPVLRDLTHPIGIPDAITGKIPEQAKIANQVLDVAIDAAYMVVSHGGCYIFESPPSRAAGSAHSIPGREQHASMWSYPRMLKLARAYRSLSVIFDQCALGAPSQKTTELLASPSIFDVLVQEFGCLRCNHIECRKFSLMKSANPNAVAQSAQYNGEMCERLAKCFVKTCVIQKKDVAPTSPVSVVPDTCTSNAIPRAPEKTTKRAMRMTPFQVMPVPGMTASVDTVWRRLAYPAADAWSHVHEVMKNTGLTAGKKPAPRDPSRIPAVAQGRMKARAFPGIQDGAPNKVLQHLYMDFTGPFMTPSIIHNFIHYCCVVDAYSGYARVFACHGQTAEAAIAALRQFLVDVRSRSNEVLSPVALVRTDQGSAFIAHSFTKYVSETVGAALSLACVYTPEQNSYAERLWLSVLSMGRVLLASAGLPPQFHPYAIQTACYLRNRLPSSTRAMRSPYMMITGTAADMSRLRVFGCLCHVFHPANLRKTLGGFSEGGKKLVTRATSGVYLGPSEVSPGSCVYIRVSPHKNGGPTVMTSAHVQFCETILPGDNELPSGSEPINMDNESDIQLAAALDEEKIDNNVPDVIVDKVIHVDPSPNDMQNVASRQPKNDDPSSINFDRQHPSRTRLEPARYGAEQIPATGPHKESAAALALFTDPTQCTALEAWRNYEMLNKNEPASIEPTAYWSAVGYAAVVQPTLELGEVTIPTSYKKALLSPHKDYWKESMAKELNGLAAMNTWDIMREKDIPAGCNLMNCHFIYDLKRNSDGSIAKFKSRLVADGNSQRQGVDFDRVFSTVIKLTTLRLLLIIANKRKYSLSSCDIRQAFLLAKIEQDLYMRIPPGLPRFDKDGNGLVTKLRKSLYGLRQAGREFNILLVEFLESLNFKRSIIDTCLFIRDTGNVTILLAVWVDDIVIASSSIEARNEFVENLNARFPIEDSPQLDWILGMKVTHKREERILEISQVLYIDDLLSKYAPFINENCKSFDVPMADTPILTADMCPEEGSSEKVKMKGKQEFYMTVVGSLLWLAACTRPDISHATSVLARFVSNPGIAHFDAMIRMLIYLRTTRTLGLTYTVPKENVGLEVYADASWCTKFSTSGALYYHDGDLFAWYSRLQRSVCHSTAESEYISASAAIRDGIFHRETTLDFNDLPKGPSALLLDSKSAIDMCFDPIAFKKTKHILRDAHFLRDIVARELFKPSHVSSEKELADIMSKAVTRPIFLLLRPHLVREIDVECPLPPISK